MPNRVSRDGIPAGSDSRRRHAGSGHDRCDGFQRPFLHLGRSGMECDHQRLGFEGKVSLPFRWRGRGSGELSVRGSIDLFLDGRDNLHVRDGSFSWSVFSPQQRFLRRVGSNMMGGLPWRTVILDDGSALASDGVVSQGHYFRVTDSTGALARTFGPVGDGRRVGGGDQYPTRAATLSGRVRANWIRMPTSWKSGGSTERCAGRFGVTFRGTGGTGRHRMRRA